MFRLFTSSSNRKIAISLVVFLFLIFSVDYWLYNRNGFTRLVGFRHLAGQILSKVERGKRFASEADVVFFGGSFIRYGISYKPAFERKVLAYNFGLSGGGPISSYLALRSVEHELRARKEKPVAVLEIVDRTVKRGLRGQWTEFPFVNAFGLPRTEIIRDFSDYYDAFEESHEGQGAQFISRIIMPSYSYRQSFGEAYMFKGLFGPFWGYEDYIGFAQVDSIATRSFDFRAPLRRDEYSPGKVNFIKKFIELARDIGLPVVLLSSPNIWLSNEGPEYYGELIKDIQSDYPEIGAVWLRDYNLTIEDFSDDGFYHLNVRGADKFTDSVLDALPLKPDLETFNHRLAATVEEMPMPALATWPINAFRKQNIGDHAFNAADNVRLLESASLKVKGPGHVILEVQAEVKKGKIIVCIGHDLSFLNFYEIISNNCSASSQHFPDERIIVSLRPMASSVKVYIYTEGDSIGTIQTIRLIKEKPIPAPGFSATERHTNFLFEIQKWLRFSRRVILSTVKEKFEDTPIWPALKKIWRYL